MKKLFGVAQLEEARSCASSIKNMPALAGATAAKVLVCFLYYAIC
jgi:hypothetical protein